MSAPPERELTRSERAAIRRLVTSLCANYDCQDKLCLPLDCPCSVSYTHLVGASRRFLAQITRHQNEVKSVSYTHLGVYKRQPG